MSGLTEAREAPAASPRRQAPGRRRFPRGRIGYWAASLLFVFVSVFPLLYALSSSFKQGAGLFSPTLWPAAPTLANYSGVFAEQPFAQNLLNSLLVAGCVVTLSLGLSLMAAWAFGRVQFRGRGLLLMLILSASMLPQVAVLSGMFELVRFFGLYDSLGALVIADLVLTLPFWCGCW